MTLPTAPGSFWLDARPRTRAGPALERDLETDVAIVGGGIAGAFTALHLARAGVRSVLLEADDLGRGATGRNAGFLLAEGAEGTAEVTRTHGSATAAALREVGLRTRREIAALPDARTFGLRWTGSLRLAADEAEADDMRHTQALVGPPLQWLAVADLPRAYRGRGFVAGLVDPGDGEVRPLDLLDAVLRETAAAAASAGSSFSAYAGTPVLAVEEGSRDVTVRTARGAVKADRVVVASNAWLSRLLRGKPAVRPVRAQMLAARVHPTPAWDRPTYATRGNDYWRRLEDGTVLIGGQRAVGGATEETDDARPASPVQPAIEKLLSSLAAPGARVEVVSRWGGTMAFTEDAVPVAGRAPGSARTWVLGGCNGHGMGWFAGLAGHVVDALTGRARGLPPCFDPAREGLSRGSVPGSPGG